MQSQAAYGIIPEVYCEAVGTPQRLVRETESRGKGVIMEKTKKHFLRRAALLLAMPLMTSVAI